MSWERDCRIRTMRHIQSFFASKVIVVIILHFSYFGHNQAYQYLVLFWMNWLQVRHLYLTSCFLQHWTGHAMTPLAAYSRDGCNRHRLTLLTGTYLGSSRNYRYATASLCTTPFSKDSWCLNSLNGVEPQLSCRIIICNKWPSFQFRFTMNFGLTWKLK